MVSMETNSGAAAQQLRNARVLVIDDEEPVRRVVRALLREAQCSVETAGDGREALHILLQKDFDVAVVDLRMPDMNGAAFMQEARSIWPWLGIVILTGFADDHALEIARLHGVTRVLSKPVDARKLRESVLAEAGEKRRKLELSASHSLDQIQQQLGVLRRFSETAIAAESLEAAMKTLSGGLGAMLACSVVGMLQIEADGQALYLNATKPVAQPFMAAVVETMLSRYEALSGNPRPGTTLRVHLDAAPEPQGPEIFSRTFTVPILSTTGLHGLLTLAFSSQDDANGHDTTFLYHAANHLSTVLAALARMRQLSVHDALTGAYNRKGLEEEYERAWQQSRRYNFPLGVAIIDIDRFKDINDTHGHQAGDQVLREFSQLTHRVARGTDIVARYGGDEMVVILPQAGPADVIAFGERLLDAVHRHIFCERVQNLQMTASIGVASSVVGHPAETSQGLLARADEALYRAKKAGRDRVALQQPDFTSNTGGAEQADGAVATLDPSQRAPSPRDEAAAKGRVLVVDDEPGIALLFARILKKQGYDAVIEHSATAALARLKTEGHSFDVLLTDLSMPDKSGLELLDEMRSINENLIKIVVTGNATLDNAVLSLRRGSYDFIEKPVVAEQLIAVIERAMEFGRLRAENRRYQLQLEDMVREKSAALRAALDRIKQSYDFTLEAMVQLLDARERSTSEHSLRVRDMAVILARVLHLSESEIEDIAKGALLHDIGKMAIPDAILLKPGKLTDEERSLMKTHASVGYRILRSSSYLEKPAEIVYSHHERWDGSGYPRGLKGDFIPIGARIFSVVDTYDAMRSARVYRGSTSPQEVIAEIVRCVGIQFDPVVVDAFLKCQPAFERIGNWESDLAAMS